MMIDEYTLLKCIGKGAFGEVFISSKQGSQKLFATKKVPKSKADSPQIKKYFINEITILREISHPYIIHFETIKHTIHNYYIITEYCNGGDLLSCSKKYQSLYYHPFTEEIVQHLMRQIISAIKYLHGRKIIHRDLKLENILVNFDNDIDKANMNMLKATIKIIDFGFATHLGASNLRYSTLGSPINMDPLLLKKLANKNQGTFNLIGYDEKADIWSLGTVCYELLIGQEVFNAQTMIDLIRKVEYGNYHVPTNLSKEVVSFLNGMLQYSAKHRLSSDELSKHAFLIKNVKDFKKLDLRKVSHKVDMQGLNINIKRNQSIWAIFNAEDEKTLIDIPGQIYEENPNQKLDELLGITDIVSNNNNIRNENPFAKPINININNKMNTNTNTANNINNNNNQTNAINNGGNIDYNLLQKQHQKNLQNDKLKRFANYVQTYPYGFGGTNANNANYYNNNNYYSKTPPKYYVKNLNGTNNITTNTNAVTPIYTDTINTNANITTNQIPKQNKVVVQYPQYQYNQYSYTNKQNPTQPVYYQTAIQNIKMAPVKSNQDLIQGFYQTTTNTTTTTNKPQHMKQPSNNTNNTYQVKINQIQPAQNIQVQNPIIIPQDNPRHKSPRDQMNKSKISAITTVTTKTVQIPKGARMPKSYYDTYSNKTNSQQQIQQKNTHSKSPISHNNNKYLYQKQMTYNEKPKDNNYNNIQKINVNSNNKYKTGTNHYYSTKEIKGYDIQEKNTEKSKDKNIMVTINNRQKKKDETYTIKYENKDFPDNNNYSPGVKITKIENTKDEYSSPSPFNNSHKKSADYVSSNNKNKKKEKEKSEKNNINNIENIKYKRNDSFPMPDSDNENEKENKEDKNKENSNDSKNDDSSENLDELIDFKLGDEICPEPEDAKYNDLNDNNDKEKEDNFEMTMKKKIMERTVERPTIGVPPPGTDPNDNFELDDDDDLNNGVFQTHKNNIFNNDDINFEI